MICIVIFLFIVPSTLCFTCSFCSSCSTFDNSGSCHACSAVTAQSRMELESKGLNNATCAYVECKSCNASLCGSTYCQSCASLSCTPTTPCRDCQNIQITVGLGVPILVIVVAVVALHLRRRATSRRSVQQSTSMGRQIEAPGTFVIPWINIELATGHPVTPGSVAVGHPVVQQPTEGAVSLDQDRTDGSELPIRSQGSQGPRIEMTISSQDDHDHDTRNRCDPLQ